jgi:hypothetical protein
MVFCLGHSDTEKLLQVSLQNHTVEPCHGPNEEEILKKRKREVSQIAGIDMAGDIHDNGSNESTSGKHNDNSNDQDDDIDDEDASPANNNDIDGMAELPNTTQSQSWSGEEKMKPTLQLLLQFDQVLTQRLLAHHINWLVAAE